ncbi:chemotaxis protein CheB [Pseudobacteriovorax antillogorgiicola]|uniref:protein-glutamate methylesterase n=1 Tax=Pseudobacteriovorax antillogorgiicola TaxID=1513793 RepID=A0A1Y6CFB3_9BACT|nr:chemotaxis protein CheB [Pseudobacteriovorax antillogorgiicola]TCS51701.1 chemotaxis response regulator CheB [Pseudobacteriovorax antillogorgiicola]SMF49207.1 Chemotaxis response regulator CheB, contains REC and protein-glutamate methylesterase domains [Pseudobacteriovorax antillogorgiicola]
MSYQFSHAEKKRVFELVDKLIGTSKVASERAEIFLNNIERRMYLNNKNNLESYLQYSSQNPKEHCYLISSLTIHTTYWFREARHFEYLRDTFLANPRKPIRVLSVGCSTGEEVYSLALLLESIRKKHLGWDYSIKGVDIDPVSIERAQKAIYNSKDLPKIPHEYHGDVLVGSGKTEGMMTLSKDVRKRCEFAECSALQLPSIQGHYDIVFCRNMLIYFDEDRVNLIVKYIADKVVEGGIFVLGHSESFSAKVSADRVGGSVFTKVGGSGDSGSEASGSKLSTLNLPDPASGNGEDQVLWCDLHKGDDISKRFQSQSEHNVHVIHNLEAGSDWLRSNSPKMMIVTVETSDASKLAGWLKNAKTRYPDTPCIIIGDEGALKHDLKELEIIADEMLDLNSIRINLSGFLQRVNNILDIRKTGGRFSQLPVVIVDDDKFVAETFATIIESAGFNTKMFFTPEEALDYARANPVQAVVSDYMMPSMNGIEFSEAIQKVREGVPIIIVTGHISADLNSKHVFRVVGKPVNPDDLIQHVQDCLLARYSGKLLHLNRERVRSLDLLVIGGSTGAPKIFQKILSQLGSQCPPTVVVQHIPPQFQDSFACDLAQSSGLKLEVVNNEVALQPNTLYVAERDRHIKVRQGPKREILVYCDDDERYKGLRPCVHHLFNSAANLSTRKVLGILLTGMGDDGSLALGSMRQAGQYTIAQDLTSSTVFGMPKVAIDHDNVDYIGSADDIRSILSQIKAA